MSGPLSPSEKTLDMPVPEVKGAHLRVRPAMVFMVFVTVPIACCLGAHINKFVFNNNGFGTYSFEYETSDGSYRREDGGVIIGAKGRSLVVRGEYGFIDPEGKRHSMRYVADANGFQPKVNDDHTRLNDRRII